MTNEILLISVQQLLETQFIYFIYCTRFFQACTLTGTSKICSAISTKDSCSVFSLMFPTQSFRSDAIGSHQKDFVISSLTKYINFTSSRCRLWSPDLLPHPPTPLSSPSCLRALGSFGKSFYVTDHRFVSVLIRLWHRLRETQRKGGGARFDTWLRRKWINHHIKSCGSLMPDSKGGAYIKKWWIIQGAERAAGNRKSDSF